MDITFEIIITVTILKRAGEWISLLLEIIITVTILKCLGPIDYKCGKGSEVQKLLPVFFHLEHIPPIGPLIVGCQKNH